MGWQLNFYGLPQGKELNKDNVIELFSISRYSDLYTHFTDNISVTYNEESYTVLTLDMIEDLYKDIKNLRLKSTNRLNEYEKHIKCLDDIEELLEMKEFVFELTTILGQINIIHYLVENANGEYNNFQSIVCCNL